MTDSTTSSKTTSESTTESSRLTISPREADTRRRLQLVLADQRRELAALAREEGEIAAQYDEMGAADLEQGGIDLHTSLVRVGRLEIARQRVKGLSDAYRHNLAVYAQQFGWDV